MENDGANEQPCLFTIGHSNHTPDAFVELLKKYGIEVVVDTRSQPASKYVPHFNKDELHRTLKRSSIQYLFLGKELGGRPQEPEFYDKEGHVLYFRLAESPAFLHGIERLQNGVRKYRVAILCSEENPFVCHRQLLIARVMAERGTKISHIRGDGTLQDDSAAPARNRERSLFDPPEENTWKSLQSVSRRRPPSSSSDLFGERESSDFSMSD